MAAPINQQVDQPQFEVLGTGTVGNLTSLDQLNALFQEGDLGEIQFFLRKDLGDEDRADVEEAIAELEAEMAAEDILPWPGRNRIALLDWPNRTLRLLFLQGFPALLALIPILIRIGFIAATIPVLLDLLEQIGITIPGDVGTLGQAVLTIAAIAAGILLLRRLGLPLRLLIPSGLLVFALLAPETAFRVLRWSRDTIQEAFGIDPLLAGLGAAVGIGGVFLGSRLGTGGLLVGGIGLAAGGLLIFQSTRVAEAGFQVPDPPIRPDLGILAVEGAPTFEVVQLEEVPSG